MTSMLLRKILKLYQQRDKLLESGDFGSGLWPVDPVIGQFLYYLIQSSSTALPLV